MGIIARPSWTMGVPGIPKVCRRVRPMVDHRLKREVTHQKIRTAMVVEMAKEALRVEARAIMYPSQDLRSLRRAPKEQIANMQWKLVIASSIILGKGGMLS